MARCILLAGTVLQSAPEVDRSRSPALFRHEDRYYSHCLALLDPAEQWRFCFKEAIERGFTAGFDYMLFRASLVVGQYARQGQL